MHRHLVAALVIVIVIVIVIVVISSYKQIVFYLC